MDFNSDYPPLGCGYGAIEELPLRDSLVVAPIVDLDPHYGYNNPLARLITGAINRPKTPTPGSLGVNDTYMLGWDPHWDADLLPKSWYDQRRIQTGESAQMMSGTYLYGQYIVPTDLPLADAGGGIGYEPSYPNTIDQTGQLPTPYFAGTQYGAVMDQTGWIPE